MKSMKSNLKVRRAARVMAKGLAFSAVFGFVSAASAVENLVDGNSTMTIDPMSPLGVNSWTVEGQNQLYSQWFYYRVGNSGPEMSIDTIGTPTVSSTANSATITYSSAAFDISIQYLLSGGSSGSGLADLNEDIAIVNKSGGLLDFHIFQYSDFNLEGTTGGDSVLLFPGLSPFQLAYQWENTTGLSESIVQNNPFADGGEVGFTPSIVSKLSDGNTDNLSGYPGPVGPGDVSFAFQWNLSIEASGPGSTATISKLKNLNINVIPEPTSAALGLLGLGLLMARRIGRRT